MAKKKNPDRWAVSNWTPGSVTVFQALGIRKGKLALPKLTPQLAKASITAQDQKSQQNTTGSNSSGGVNSVGTIGTSEQAAIRALLKALGAPATQANINSLAAWYRHENTGWPPGVKNNPWNTTLPMPGAATFNSAGVKEYTSIEQGVTANAITMQKWYPGIVAALKAGNGLCGSNLATEFGTWSGGGYRSVC